MLLLCADHFIVNSKVEVGLEHVRSIILNTIVRTSASIHDCFDFT